MCKKGFMRAVVLGIALLTAQTLGGYETIVGEDNSLKLSPLKEGLVKILSIARYPAHYDSIELANHLESEITTIRNGSSYYPNDFHRKTVYWHYMRITEKEMEEDALKALAGEYDIIIIGASPAWSVYPETVKKAVINKVKLGAALLTFDAAKGLVAELKQGSSPLQEIQLNINRFPPIQEKPLLTEKYYRFGGGMVAVLKHQININWGYLVSPSYTTLRYEYKFRRIANIIYKLSKGIDKGTIKSAAIENAKSVALQFAPSKNARVIKFRIKDQACQTLEKSDKIISLKPGTLTLKIPLPELPNGEYGVEVEMLENEKVLDWISLIFNVDYNPKITTATLDKDTLHDGDKLKLHLAYSDDVKKSALLMKFEDAHGRCYSEKEYKNPSEKIELTLPGGSLTVLNYIKLYLYDGSKLQDTKVVEFTLPQKAETRDFHMLLWMLGGNSVRARRYLKTVYNYGISGTQSCGYTEESARNLAYANLRGIPYTTYMAGRMLDGHLFNDQWITSMKKRCRVAAKAYSKYAGMGYNLGTEAHLNAFQPEGRFSNSKKVVEQFRRYLEKEYGDIDKLNAQWESSYSGFNEIGLKNEKDLFVSDKNPSPWVDYRMFLTDEFMNLHYEFRDEVHSIDPGAKAGYDACENFSSYGGNDWYKYTRGLDINTIYATYIVNDYPNKIFNGLCIRSFTDKSNLRGCAANNTNAVWGVKYMPWYMVLCQFNSIWWWTGSYLGPEVNAFDITLKPSPIFGEIMKTTTEIQQGPATLLMNASFDFDPIAIHYSENNWHASTLSSGIGNHVNNLGLKNEYWFKKPLCGEDTNMRELFGDVEPLGHYTVSSKNFITLFHDLGYQPRMLARQEIEMGQLNSGRYRVLALPFVESLSTKEIAEIYRFVENGGLLIADYRTGIRDKHGRFYEKSPLDKLFGIERSSFDLEKKYNTIDIDSINVGYRGSYHFYSGQLRGLFFNPNLTLTTGQAAGWNEEGVPVYIVNKYKDGHTLFLNSDMNHYFNARRAGAEDDYRDILRNQIMNFANVKARYSIMVDKAYAPHTEVFAYADNGIDYIGMIRDFYVRNHSDFEITVPLKKKSYVYSVRDNTFMGYTDVVKSILKSGEALLFAQCPYRIDDIAVTGENAVKKGANLTLEIEVISKNADRLSNHVVNLKVYDPDGENIIYLNKNLYLKNGKGEYTIPIALNDQKGAWKIEVKEVISGKRASKKFIVR